MDIDPPSFDTSQPSTSHPSTPVGSPVRGGERRVPAGSPAGSQWFSPRQRVTYSDRFIPSRAARARLDFSVLEREAATAEVSKNASEREDLNPAYNILLRSELLGYQCPAAISLDKATQLEQLRGAGSPSKKSIFSYKSGDMHSPIAGPPPQSPYLTSPVGNDNPLSPMMSPRPAPRKITRQPVKVLDAPGLQDDFYLNLLDWSAQNVLAVGLASCVYLWSATTSKVTRLCELENGEAVTSISWSQRGTYCAVGTNSGEVQLWDVNKLQKARTLVGHKTRVGCMAWSSHILASGSRDRNILLRDVRVADSHVSKLVGHKSEVCGLKWSPDDKQLASGGNDNQLNIWGLHSTSPVLRFQEHVAAVKAIAWSPHQHGILASGGGTADRCIRFWNTSTGAALSCMDTGSQVCNLAWSKNVNELVSAHGYSQNQIFVWKYPSMSKLATLTGHSFRVLYLAVSPDGQTIVTGAGDETLRFWNVFPEAKSQGNSTSVASLMRAQIR